MSNYAPPAYNAYPEERRPLPPPPLPPRRPLSDFYGRAENAPQLPQGMIYGQGQSGGSGSAAKPETPSMPHRDQYGVYGANSQGQYSPTQTNANVYGRTSNPLYSQPPPVRKQSIPYGQTGNVYSSSSPYGQDPPPPSQQPQYGQSNPYGQQPYGNPQNQAPSPYGKSASPNIAQEAYMQNIPSASYQSSPPAAQTMFSARPQYSQQMEGVYGQQPQYGQTLSPPPIKSPPLGQPSQPTTLSPPNSATIQPVHGYQDSQQLPDQSQYYPYHNRPMVGGFNTSTHTAVGQQQRPATAVPYNQQGVCDVPPQQQENVNPGHLSLGSPYPPPAQHKAPPTNDLNRISSPPLSKQPPQPSQSIPSQTLEKTPAPAIISPPLEPTISPIHPFTPSPQPLPSPAKSSEGPSQSIGPLSPAPKHEAPKDEMTIFLDESLSRYRELLEKERGLIDEGKTLDIPALFEDFLTREIQVRRERYHIPQPPSRKVASQNGAPPQTSVISSESHSKPLATDEVPHPPEPTTTAISPVQVAQSPPATTFSATSSQVTSYMGDPLRSSTLTSPRPAPSEPTSAPPAPPVSQSQVSVAENTPCQPVGEGPTRNPIKEHDIPPIPRSESLAAVLSSLPSLASPDPILSPFQERLTAIKDLSWVDADQFSFDSSEQDITSRLLAASQARQESHSLRQQELYKTNQLEQADLESKEFNDLEQRYKETELKHSIQRWRTEYCDPTYSRLHTIFGDITALHKQVVETESENTEDQVVLLNQIQSTLMEILSKLDIITDSLRLKQHSLKIHRVQVAGDWELIQQFDKQKEEEDILLQTQRGEYRLDKVRLHAQCVKYLVDYGLENLSERKRVVEEEVQEVLAGLPDVVRRKELPEQGSEDAYPSDELIEQLEVVQLAVTGMNQRINSLFALLEQNELETIVEEASPALNKAYSSSDFDLAEKLNSEQRTKEKQIVDTYLSLRQSRDAESSAFSNYLSSYIDAHNTPKQARLQASALPAPAWGGSGGVSRRGMGETVDGK